MATAILDCLQTLPIQAVKIGEGRYREVFRIGDNALKTLKPYVRENYGIFQVNFPAEFYTKYKFGISDFNQFEYDAYREFIERVPPELRNRFAHIHQIGKVNGKSFSLSDLMLNSDGSLSQPLSQHSPIDNSDFWRQIDELEKLLMQKEIPIMDIRGENIAVHEGDEEVTSVLIDFKRYGQITYPFQMWLSSEQQLFRKINRRFQRLKEQYKPY